ncbi:hypothetical protein [uncultured Alistipes sp.]|uniref:hypothetical protein n=1 Tax=uncultured Alistipes sp. TaxID=538949 RepID=UPI0025953CBC|nr:hypothetical protein [uncultured Alistipes sp.]
MQNNKLTIMVKAFVFIMVCVLAISCDKEETISVPKNITGTDWQQTTEERVVKLTFNPDAQCVYSEKTNDGISEYNYAYEYHKPNIKLTPEDSEREVLTGRIEQSDSHSIVMRLFQPNGKECFTAYRTTYWKH